MWWSVILRTRLIVFRLSIKYLYLISEIEIVLFLKYISLDNKLFFKF